VFGLFIAGAVIIGLCTILAVAQGKGGGGTAFAVVINAFIMWLLIWGAMHV
jgi:hypothetical protein